MKSKSVDRRSEPRIKTETTLSVSLRVGDDVSNGHLVDINRRGAFVATDLTLDRGIYLSLEFDFPGSNGCQAIRAVVARSKGAKDGKKDGTTPGLGLIFLATDEEERRRIAGLATAIVSLDLLSYEKKRDADWMSSTDRTVPIFSTSDTRPD